MSIVPLPKLRVEATPDVAPAAVKPAAAPHATETVAHWRKLARDTGERLSYAESQLKDLRTAADDGRARFSKYKDRLDKANEHVNDLQVQVVRLSTENESLRHQLARQEQVARHVHAFRESVLHGPLWELFTELAVVESSPQAAGGSEQS